MSADATVSEREGGRRIGAVIRWLTRDLGLTVGLLIIAVFVFCALFAPLLAPQDPYIQDLSKRLTVPVWYDGGSWDHPLGMDGLGRDVLSRVLHGARISLTIGALVTLIGGAIGITLGTVAGYFGGRVDMVVSFLITVRLSLPVVIIALATVALFGGSLPMVVAVIGGLLWDRFAVVARSATMQVRTREYIKAAEAVGSSSGRIILAEVLPNILNALIVVATLEVGAAILMEATLSFLGFGVQAPLPSWGLMLSEGRKDLFFSPWLIAIPGTALFCLVLSLNLIGNALQKWQDEKTR